jgi:hypothetical protein
LFMSRAEDLLLVVFCCSEHRIVWAYPQTVRDCCWSISRTVSASLFSSVWLADSPGFNHGQSAILLSTQVRTISHRSVFESWTPVSLAFNPGQSGLPTADSPGLCRLCYFLSFLRALISVGWSVAPLGHHQRYPVTRWLVIIPFSCAFPLGSWFWDSDLKF